MTTALVPQSEVSAQVLETVLLQGDLGKLDAKGRVQYMTAVCESLGLNPLTKPFEFISLNGKLTMYAKKDCTEQLRKIHGVSITIVAREVIEGVFVVTARAQDKYGRHDESTGAVPIDNVKGESRANAVMKAETKAKRRVTLSICGLGVLDESEVDSVPGAKPEYTPPATDGSRQERDSIRAAVAQEPPAPKASAPTASTTTAAANVTAPANGRTSTTTDGTTAIPGTPKTVTAPSIKHSGDYASADQVKYLHALARKAGVECPGPERCGIAAKKYSKRAGGLVDATIRCDYHKALFACKDQDGNGILTSTNLCPSQISHLISRLEAKVAKDEAATQEIRSSGAPDISVLTEEKDELLEKLFYAAKDTGDEDEAMNRLCEFFKVVQPGDLTTERCTEALQRLLNGEFSS